MTTVLRVSGSDVVTYEAGTKMPRQLSPRPYLQARTLHGEPVTQLLAADHAHHFGVSLALPDVDGASYWGGRTFVRGMGSTLLENHGTQSVVKRKATDTAIEERLEWLGPKGMLILTERRTIHVHKTTDGWILAWRSVLHPHEGDLTFGSPHTNGRAGAFYGGIFWRTPFAAADLVTADGAGAQNAHGSGSPWLAVLSDAASLVAWTPPGFPWFVRDEGYVGFCPAVAVRGRRSLPANEELALELRVAVCDGRANQEWVKAAISELAHLAQPSQ